jgi:glycerophosphoryl diester phosphodiesterase
MGAAIPAILSDVHHPFFARAAAVFAHRGGSALAPENTLAAFDRGAALGADGLELDVHLSRDGVVVVHHDRRLERTTNLHGAVADHTAAALARADAGYRFTVNGDFPYRGRGVGVPALGDVLRRYRDLAVIVEIKVDTAAMADAVIDAVRAADAVERVCLGSFGATVLCAARARLPEIATSAARREVRWALYRSWGRVPRRRAAYDGYQVPEFAGRTRVVSPRFIRDAHRAGLGVQIWTVDSVADAERLLRWGADALITDRPDLIVPVVRSWSRR